GESLWCFWITPEQNPSGGNAKLLRWLLASGHQRRQRLAHLARPLTAAEVERYWHALGDADPEAAAEAPGYLGSAPGAGRLVVPFLRKHVKAIPPSDVKRLSQLIADLDNDEFAVRDRAQRELERMGEEAAPALRKALAGKPALEARLRIESILKK